MAIIRAIAVVRGPPLKGAMPKNRRKHIRYKVAVAAEVLLDGNPCAAETRDISLGGVSIAIEREVKQNSTVELALILTQDGIEDPDEEPIETKADVIWNAPSDRGAWMIGLRFTGLSKEHASHLQRFITALSKDVR